MTQKQGLINFVENIRPIMEKIKDQKKLTEDEYQSVLQLYLEERDYLIQQAYKKATATAWEVYEKARAPSLEIYEKAEATAWEVYKKAMASALYQAITKCNL